MPDPFPTPPIAPLEPLPYQPPQPKLRPGLMTAIAVVSIVLASLSALSSAGSIVSGFAMLAMSRITVPMTPAPVPTTAATTGPTPATTVVLPPMSPFRIDPSTLVLTSIGGLSSLLAAGVLLAAGIQILRNARSGNRLHWIYIAIKVPVTLLVAVATYLFTRSIMNNVAASAPAGALGSSFTEIMVPVQTLLGAAMSLAYPITLVFLLRTRTAREYFASLTA